MDCDRSIVTFCRFGEEHGWGHITRCSALNEWARSMGWNTELRTTSDPRQLTDEHRASFGNITEIEEMDLELILRRGDRLDVVLIDELNQPDSFFKRARSIANRSTNAKLVAIDDMKCRSMESLNLVLNTELGLNTADYLAEECLLGEKYALIRKGFSDARRRSWPSGVTRIPVSVMMGGTDPFGYTLKVLESLLQFQDLSFAPVVISGDGANFGTVQMKLSQFSESEYVKGLSSVELGSWISACRFGVIGCGSTIYEYAALESPFVGICVSENQKNSASRIESDWKLPVVTGISNSNFERDLYEAIKLMITRLSLNEKFHFGEVDFFGARRVMELIEKL